MAKKEANKALAMRIRAAREEKGYTQEQLAKLIGASQQSVGSWEVGRQQPRGLLRVHRLSEVLGIPVKELASADSPSLAVHTPDPIGISADAYEYTERMLTSSLTEIDEALIAALPQKLRQYVGQPIVHKGISYAFNYYSPKCLISVIEPQEVIDGIISAKQPRINIYKELLGRIAIGETGVKRHHFAVIFVHTGSSSVRVSQALINEALLAEVNLDICYTYAEVAKRIQEYERLPTEYDEAD